MAGTKTWQLGVALIAVVAFYASCSRRTPDASIASSAGEVDSAAAPAADTTPLTIRPAKWAVPMQRPALPNLHRVSPELCRGAQPEREGFGELRKMGVKTVVNLRSFHSDKDLLGDTGLAYESIPCKAWHPEDEDVVRFLKIVTDPKRTPVFVHCQHGADRTGAMCAIYRIVVQDWSREDAIREMVSGGYHFHGIWKDLVDYLRKLDVERIRREAGLPPVTGGGEKEWWLQPMGKQVAP